MNQKVARRYGIRTNIGEFLAQAPFYHNGQLDTSSFYRKIPCYLGWIYLEIDIDGTMRPCENSMREMGHAAHSSLNDLWYGTAYDSFRRESILMPNTGRYVEKCMCQQCSMVQFNRAIYNLTHVKKVSFNPHSTHDA